MVVLPEPVSVKRGLLIVRLRDTAMADAPAPLLALTRREVSGERLQRLDFVLRLRRPLTRYARPALEAELRAEAGRKLAPGDWLTETHVPYRGEDEDKLLQVPVARIR